MYGSIPVPGGSGQRRRSTGSFASGSVNSVEHFRASYTRAQSFLSMGSPRRQRSFFIEATSGSDLYEDSVDEVEDDDIEGYYGDEESGLLRAPPERRERRVSYSAPVDEGYEIIEEHEANCEDSDVEPVIIRTTKDPEGNTMTRVAGQSTAQQTIFNSVNVLIGIGVFSLPLGFAYSGWLFGMIFMLFAGGSTMYTAILLSKCQDTDHTLVTYADIAYAAFGTRARVLVSILFSVELLGSGVSMFVLFADSLNALIPQVSVTAFKLIGFALVTPLTLLPLRFLSVASLVGISGILLLLGTVLSTGVRTDAQPGSLLHPMDTWFLPRQWFAVPLSIGIFMVPWGGHAVFPNIYRDMRRPKNYKNALATVYQLTFFCDFAFAVSGFLMFGRTITGEVTKNVLLIPGTSKITGYIITGVVGLIPVVKTPLSARPIVSTVDILLGINSHHHHYHSHHPQNARESSRWKEIGNAIGKMSTTILTVASFCALSILFPDFERILAFAGSALCVVTCLTLPIAFYLKLYKDRISRTELVVDYILISLSIVLAILGTIWSCLPTKWFRLDN